MPITLADAVVFLSAEDSQLKKDLNQTEKGTASFFKSFGSKANLLMTGAIAAGAATATAALVQVGKTAFDVAFEMDNLERSFEKTLGVSSERAQELGDIVQDVYVRGLGDSLTDVAGAVTEVNQALGEFDLGDTEIEQLTADVLLLSETFDVDLSEAVRTTSILMKSGLAGDGREALDIMTAGFQNGLNVSDDLLDTLNEYAEDFARLGLTADETLTILNNGLNAGVFNTDKIADAMNEFGIRVKEVDIVEDIGEINEELGELILSFQRGEISEFELFNTAITLLENMEDPMARNQAGIMLFGTMWEDLGEDAILALNDIDQGMIETSGTTEQLGEKTKSLNQRFEILKRRGKVALEPLGEKMISLLEDVFPTFELGILNLISLVDNFGLKWQIALSIGETTIETLAKKAASAIFGLEETKPQDLADEQGWYFDPGSNAWRNLNAPGTEFLTRGGPVITPEMKAAQSQPLTAWQYDTHGNLISQPPLTPEQIEAVGPGGFDTNDNGGLFQAGTPFGVGDIPFEIFVPNQNGNAITPDQLAQAMQGGGGGGSQIQNLNVYVSGGADGEETAQNIINGLRLKGIQIGGAG
jgi:hypothetical protein